MDHNNKLNEFEQDKLRSYLTRNIDLSGRRVINASKSQAPTDYVIRQELTDFNFAGGNHGIRYAEDFDGVDLGEKIHNAILDLPSTGGIVDARFFTGTQHAASNIFAGINKQFTLLLGYCFLRCSVTQLLQNIQGARIIGVNTLGDTAPTSMTTLIWDGSDAGTVLLIDTSRDCYFSNFGILRGNGSIGIGIQIDTTTGPTSTTNNYFKDISIESSVCGVQIGNTSSVNNDLHTFDNVYIINSGTYGYYIHSAQSKFIKIIGGAITFRDYGIWLDFGSFIADKVNFSHCGISDISVQNPTDIILVQGCQSEGAFGFFQYRGGAGGTGAAWAVTLKSNRVDRSLAAATFELLSYHAGGPFNVEGNDFANGVHNDFETLAIGSANINAFNSRGNIYSNGNVFAGLSNSQVNSDGDVYLDATQTSVKFIGTVTSGFYTPTLTNISGISSSSVTANSSQYMKIGNVVTVSGKVIVTSSAAPFELGISLPFVPASNWPDTYQVSGTAYTDTFAGPGLVIATFGSKTASLFANVAPSGNTWWYHFTYRII